MYVMLGRMKSRAEVTQDRYGELVLTLPGGARLDEGLAESINSVVADMTSRDTLLAELLEHPLTYDAAARALGVSKRWLQYQVHNDPTFPHTRIAGRVTFLIRHIIEVRERFERGEVRYGGRHGGRPRIHQPPKPQPVQLPPRGSPLIRRPGPPASRPLS